MLALLIGIPSALSDMSDQIYVTVRVAAPIVDNDHDGMADSWEVTYFGSIFVATAATDYDQDRFPDVCEYLAGTHPRNANSLLRIEDVDILPGPQVRVTWQSATNNQPSVRRYDIYAADSVPALNAGGYRWREDVVSDGAQTTIAGDMSGVTTRVFRVELHRP